MGVGNTGGFHKIGGLGTLCQLCHYVSKLDFAAVS